MEIKKKMCILDNQANFKIVCVSVRFALVFSGYFTYVALKSLVILSDAIHFFVINVIFLF